VYTLYQRLLANLPVRMLKFIFNLWPPFWGAGITIKKISPDFREIAVVLKLHWYNQNYMGVHFGGSLYSMTDAFPMVMTSRNLGTNYIVWDKAARIDYIKPGRGAVYANFSLTAEQIRVIRHAADTNEKYLFDYEIDVVNDKGEMVAKIVKTLYVRRKSQSLIP
jgi:acyl-coenzyme A thioesterase PaaI-like protein